VTTHQNCQLLSLLQRTSQPPIFLTVSTSPRTIPSVITVSLSFLLSESDCCFHSLTYEHRWKSLIIQEHVSIMSVPVPLDGGSRSGACGGVLLTSLRLVVDKTRRLTTATTSPYQHLQTVVISQHWNYSSALVAAAQSFHLLNCDENTNYRSAK